MRYPFTETEAPLRTRSSHITNINDAIKMGKLVNDVKGICSVLELQYFDVVWGFPYDYIHSLSLGVTRQF